MNKQIKILIEFSRYLRFSIYKKKKQKKKKQKNKNKNKINK